MLFESSEEGSEPGLGWISGRVSRFEAHEQGRQRQLRLPHMGWNTIELDDGFGLLAGLTSCPEFYFLHSFVVHPEDPLVSKAYSDYHGRFTAVVCSGNLVGTQFHPEKSHANGIRVLQNFATEQF